MLLNTLQALCIPKYRGQVELLFWETKFAFPEAHAVPWIRNKIIEDLLSHGMLTTHPANPLSV